MDSLNVADLADADFAQFHVADERMFSGRIAVEQTVRDEQEQRDGSVSVENRRPSEIAQ